MVVTMRRICRPEVFVKKMLLKISQNSQGNTCAEFFFKKVADVSLQLY